MTGAPDQVRFQIAAGLLRETAFDRWTMLRGLRVDWAYADFKEKLILEFRPSSVMTDRESTFFTTLYDHRVPMSQVVDQFKRELVYCGHLCQNDEARIRILTLRLSPAILLHTSSLGRVSLDRFIEVILADHSQRLRSAALYSAHPSSQSDNKR